MGDDQTESARAAGSEPRQGGLADVLRRSLTVGGKPFEHLYLETSFLIGADWPRPSQRLMNVTTLCGIIGIGVYLPEPVMLECESHWMRDWDASYSKGEAARSELVERLESLEFPDEPKLIIASRDEVLQRYRTQAQQTLATQEIKMCP